MHARTTSCRDYLLPPGFDADALAIRLQSLGMHEGPPQRCRRRLYDSFDWRLFHAGLLLEHSDCGDGGRLYLHNGKGSARVIERRRPPRFAADLAEGPLRGALEGALEMRALLPQAIVCSERRSFRLEDAEGKLLLGLQLDESRLCPPGGRRRVPLERRLCLLPVRGYEASARRLRELLSGEPGLLPASEGLWPAALAAAGATPGSYSSKPDVALDPAMRADRAAKRILLHLADIMQVNLEGTVNDTDSEFLHEYRVALRRSRAALAQIKGIFAPRDVARFRAGLGWLGEATGPTRDLHVYLLGLPAYCESLPPPLGEALAPLRSLLERRQRQEQLALARALRSARYAKLMTAWRRFLEAPVPAHSRQPNAMRPVRAVAVERIRKMHKRVLSEGRAINDASPPEELHELRKSCKKLRYLLEFFQGLFPRRQVRRLIKSMKGLQEVLGDYQDLAVQMAALGRFEAMMAEEGELPAATREAIDRLLADLHTRQAEARNGFAAVFAAFDNPAHHALFGALFPKPADDR